MLVLSNDIYQRLQREREILYKKMVTFLFTLGQSLFVFNLYRKKERETSFFFKEEEEKKRRREEKKKRKTMTFFIFLISCYADIPLNN